MKLVVLSESEAYGEKTDRPGRDHQRLPE